MKTLTTKKKSGPWETPVVVKDGGQNRAICVKLHPGYIEVWQKGRQAGMHYAVDYATLYQRAALMSGPQALSRAVRTYLKKGK